MSLEHDLEAAMRTWVDALSPHTRSAYERGLIQFAEYLCQEGKIPLSVAPADRSPAAPMRRDHRAIAAQRMDLVTAAGVYLFRQGPGPANALVQAYIQHLCEVDEVAGVPAYTRETVKQRVSAIRWAVREARRRGIVVWQLDVQVPNPTKDPQTGRLRVKPGRQMRGPTLEQMRQILDLATARGRGKAGDGARWLVVVSLIAHETLREHEICALDLDDLDVQAKALTVVRKKQSEPSVIPLSARTWNAMRRWVARRGRKPGPLIWGSELRAGTQTVTNRRLTPDGVYHIVHALGLSCELSTSPHKLRHTAITVGQAVRERLGIPLQDAMARAGHMSVAAHERYLDADLDNVRRLSDGVADALHDAP